MKYCFINNERDAVMEYFKVPTSFSYSDRKFENEDLLYMN